MVTSMLERCEVTPVLPRLVIPAPECGHCGAEVQIEGGGAWCEDCRVAWESLCDGAESVPDPDAEGSDVPCEIRDAPVRSWDVTYVYGPCILPSGHESGHLCPTRREPIEQVSNHAGD